MLCADFYNTGQKMLLIVLVLGLGMEMPAVAAPAKSSEQALSDFRGAASLQNQQLHDLAVAAWREFLERHVDDPLTASAWHYLGVCQFQLQQYDQAETALQTVVTKYPKFERLAEVYYQLGLAQYNQAEPAALERAVASLQKVVADYPQAKQQPLARFYLAEALYSHGKLAPAIEVYQAFSKNHPQHSSRAQALYGLGVAQEESGQMAAAGQTYAKLLQEFPKFELATEVGMRQADTQLAAKKYGAAAAGFLAAAETPGFPLADYARLRRGACLYEQQQYEQAAGQYVELVEKHPQSSYVGAATLAAGKSFYLAGKYPQAREWLKRRQEQGGPEAFEAVHWTARTLLEEKRPAAALQAVEEVLPDAADRPWFPQLLMDRADALYELPERRAESVAVYAQVVRLFPEHASAAQAAYLASYAALSTGQYEQAVKHAEQFRQKFSQHRLALDVLNVAAESRLQLGQYDQAAEAYAHLLADGSQRPEWPQWWLRLALCRQLAGKHDQAVAGLQAKLDTLTVPGQLAEAHSLLATSQFELGNDAATVAACTASLKADSQWAGADQTRLLLARAQQRQGQTDEALRTVEELIDTSSESPLLARATFRLAEFQAAAGQLAEAAKTYEQVVTRWPQAVLAPHALAGLAWAQIGQSQYDLALKTLEQLIGKHPQHATAPRAHYARAIAREQQKDYAGAVADVEIFLQSKPARAEQSDALYLRGLAQVGMEQYAQAMETFEQIAKDDPQYKGLDKVWYEIAWARTLADQPEEAAQAFARLAAERPESVLAAEALYRVGEHAYGQEQYREAAQAYAAGLEKADDDELSEKAAYKLAWAYYQAEEFAQALTAFDQQAKRFPQGALRGDALVMAGECLFKQAQYAEALARFEQAQTAKPSNEQFTVLALLHAGQAAGKLGQWKKSLELLSQASKQFPKSDYRDELLYEQGWAQQNLGNLDAALQRFEQVAVQNPYEVGARARFMAGEIYFQRKDYQRAIRTFFKVAYGYGAPESPESYHQWQANATFEAARCCEMLNKQKAAQRLFRELIERYPESDQTPLAKQKLESAK